MAQSAAGVVQVNARTEISGSVPHRRVMRLLQTTRIVGVALVLCGADVSWAQTPPAVPPIVQPGRGGGGGRPRGIAVMSLTTSAFTDGGQIPSKYAQTGRDVSPPLQWSGAPDSTRSFVLLVHDADVAIGDGTDDFLHWMVWGIPGSATSLAEGLAQGPQMANGMRQIGATGPFYRGPAAPATGPMHHYQFELYALDATVNVPAVGLAVPATRNAIMAAMAGHVRGKGVLVGLYRRPAP